MFGNLNSNSWPTIGAVSIVNRDELPHSNQLRDIASLDESGRITLPESTREALGWKPGSNLVVDANEKGELILRAERIATDADPSRFEKALGTAEIKWPGTTDEYMALIRGDD